MKRRTYAIITEKNVYKKHFTIKTMIVKDNRMLFCHSRNEHFKHSLYFLNEKLNAADVRKINDYLIKNEVFKEKIKNYYSFLGNTQLRNYKNYKVLDFKKYFLF